MSSDDCQEIAVAVTNIMSLSWVHPSLSGELGATKRESENKARCGICLLEYDLSSNESGNDW